jgi:NAD(P)-dependent dehydrogenase (short-subunit alcohol dehydrogenase family)
LAGKESASVRAAEKVAIVRGLSGIGAAVVARLACDGMIVVAADMAAPSMELETSRAPRLFLAPMTPAM